MHRANLLIFFGVLVILAPFAGLPLSWLEWILPIIGILVLIIGITYRRERIHASATPGTYPQSQ